MGGDDPREGNGCGIIDRWVSIARRRSARVVLADGSDPRAVAAARRLEQQGLARPVLMAEPATRCTEAVRAAAAASRWCERIDLSDPLHVAALMVAAGDADACVAGATRTTADVVRAALYCIGPAPGVQLISSCFVMILTDGSPVAYADCAVVPEPDAGQLSDIAVATSQTFKALTGVEPRVAMLSYSSLGSAGGISPDRMREAARLARSRAAGLVVDGELQFDAAWVPEVASRKTPGSPLGGRANVFIFPNLDAGNIAYKITQRLAGARAFGPLLQGASGVIHDLSRGCTANDIATVALIAACQASQAAA